MTSTTPPASRPDVSNAQSSTPVASTTNTLLTEPIANQLRTPASESSNSAQPALAEEELRPKSLPAVSSEGQTTCGSPPKVSSGPEGNQATQIEESNVDTGEEDGDLEKKTRGKPSNFTGARLVAMQKALKQYMELKTKKEKTQFLSSFAVEFMAEFPLSKYPIPRSRLASRAEFVEKSEEDVKAMTRNQKAVYQRSLKASSATEEELYFQMIKDWILWKQTTARKSEGGMTGALFRAELEKKKKLIKPQFNHFVMKHPDHKMSVLSRSSETGRLDRLPSRAQAVKDFLKDMPEEEAEALKAEYEEMLKALEAAEEGDEQVPLDVAVQRGRRKNFGSLAQDVLNIWRKLTGLNLVLLAGECIDGDADYDSCVIFSKPDDCPDMDAGEGIDFDRFSNTFLHWLKGIYTKTHPEHERSSQTPVSGPATSTRTTPAASQIPAPVSGPMLTSEQHAGAGDQGKQQSRSKRGRGRTRGRDEPLLTDEETPEPSEPSDIGSESEDEEERESMSQRPPMKPHVPVNSDGLWEKNEEGLPVLIVPMCDLTREQQAAFTRECAMAIGLTKAVQDLEDDIRKNGKGKGAKGSRYKGSKATRKSSRLQTAKAYDADNDAPDGQILPEDIDQAIAGEGLKDSEMSGATVDDDSGEVVVIPDDISTGVIQSIDNVENLPAWAKAVVMGYADLDMPQMEPWAKFDVQGCSMSFLKDYGEWLLGPAGAVRPEVWSVLVYKWIEVEEEWNKRDIGAEGVRIKMLKSRRPQGYLQWFKYGRLRWEQRVPSEVVAENLGQEWWIWWSKVVNPRWRPKSPDGMVMPGGKGNWEAVRIPGKDGFVLVLVSLRWWCDLLDHPGKDLLWLSTVKAVYTTLVELLKDVQTLTTEEENGTMDEKGDTEDAEQGKEAVGDKRKR
ncbi:SERTA domain-containing protein 3 [Paramarasmius palmivorus]|uniref:SERTA domain-containing protein 3 n=1 Tax=Paramarasmius palmivorus TaxID=297713 RepID=A0AAW0BKW2_9AGAR